MRQRGQASPDVADALMLAFVEPTKPGQAVDLDIISKCHPEPKPGV